jgi:hypothetical protein
LCRSADGERKDKVAEIAALWSERVSEKKERRGDDILVTSELVESHILTGSLRDSGWAESRR